MSYFNYNSKNVFYHTVGKGRPVVFLHGNTGSSKMFEPLLPLYQDSFEIILIDFLGNGRSDRVDKFPDDIWLDEGLQTIALLEHLGYERADLVGTSGGAIAAINAALERPDLLNRVVADSFPGQALGDGFVQLLVDDREFSTNDVNASQFYEWCQGDDWQTVVEMDTDALVRFAEKGTPLFRKDLSTLEIPILMMGSRQDHLSQNDLSQEYEQIKAQVRQGSVHMFERGMHPAIATNAEEAARIICDFLS